jgi:anti-sigma factor RsiW
MTRCGIEFETLSAFVDGELSAPEELDLRRHVERCDRCGSIIETLLATKQAVASTAELRPVPHSLRQRVGELCAEPATKHSVWKIVIPALAVAFTIVAVTIYRPMLDSGARAEDRLTRAMVEDHIHFLTVSNPIQVATDDPQQIAQAFADQFAFRLEFPNLPGAELLGGRLCWLHGRKAVLAFYRTPSGRLSLFVLNKEAFANSERQETKCTSTGGYEVCLVVRTREVLALVADRQQAAQVMPNLKKLAASEQ